MLCFIFVTNQKNNNCTKKKPHLSHMELVAQGCALEMITGFYKKVLAKPFGRKAFVLEGDARPSKRGPQVRASFRSRRAQW